MSEQRIDSTIDNPESSCVLPRHPLFDTDKDQASFTDCIDAIDRVRSIIALYDFLELEDNGGGLSSDAAFGYYWISVTTRGALSYVSHRLMELDEKKKGGHKQASAYLSALAASLSTPDTESRERFLNNTVAQMNLTRPDVDKFIGGLTNK